MEADEGLYTLYHNDFRLLNGKLLEHYGFTSELKETFSHFPAIIDLEEVQSEDVERFIPFVLGDMDYNPEDVHKDLNVFTFDQIIGYIETAVEVGMVKIKPLLA
ncbi:hypothetical protein MUB24_16670 [Lederbergia sp. NSJ-179]|uniref:hypothetical protein n=1 Tax=Lederbergia sp. NSJ-179 TaxID=2931402 RepID=UPI001FD379E7|nr:hypothetical protein [Lederbergia sp. NSJ-179]MCJ7842500.1 hypothetical protein [Lederbergia sp. NSJ-179]